MNLSWVEKHQKWAKKNLELRSWQCWVVKNIKESGFNVWFRFIDTLQDFIPTSNITSKALHFPKLFVGA